MTMRVCIRRGAQEIGGNCIELEAAGSRILLDLGRPLSAEWDEEVPLPDVAGLVQPDPSLLGVVVSHGHQDHWGLATQMRSDVPVFVGGPTSRILREAAFFTRGWNVEPAGELVHRSTFDLGPFAITPFLMDHSAYDAYSLLIEAEGRRLFYSADVQAHGRKHAIFSELLRKPPTDVDVLLLEGTNIRPEPEDGVAHQPTEESLVDEMTETFRSTKGLVAISHSSQNIDCLVTIYKAARKSGRTLVLDLYGASVARATGNDKIPQLGDEWPHVRVFLTGRQIGRIKETSEFHRAEEVKPYRLFGEDIAAHPERYVLTFNRLTGVYLDKLNGLGEAHAVWSLWPGYLDEGSGKLLRKFLDEKSIPLSIHHVTGHAYPKDLQRLAAAIDAKRVVPIHSFGQARFAEFFENVEVHADDETWAV